MDNEINENKITEIEVEADLNKVVSNAAMDKKVTNLTDKPNCNSDENTDIAGNNNNKNGSAEPTKSRKPLGILLMILLIGAAIAVICITLFLPKKPDASILKLAELSQSEIESIVKYNSDNGTKFRSLTLDVPHERKVKVYSTDKGDIMLEERITITETNDSIVFYALDKSNRVDILETFFSAGYRRMEINEINVTFNIAESDGIYTARFACIIGDNAYYAECISLSPSKWSELAQQLTK